MFLKYFVLGFVIKIVASLDDALTRIPIVANLAKKRSGRIAFSIGTLLALAMIIILAILFSAFLSHFPYTRYVSGSLIFLLAIAIYFDIFSQKEAKAKKELRKIKRSTAKHLLELAGAGFFISLITLIDDSVAFIPLFLTSSTNTLFSVIGIVTATILQIIVIVYFADKIKTLKYKKEISSLGLLLLSVLTFLGLI